MMSRTIKCPSLMLLFLLDKNVWRYTLRRFNCRHLWHKFTSLFYFQYNFFTTKCISSFFPYLSVHIFNLILFYYMHLLSVFRVVMSLRFRKRTMFGSPLPPVVLGGLMSYLFYLCLFAHSRVQHVFNIWVTWRCLIRDRNCLSLASTWVHRRFFVSSCYSSFLAF